MSVELNPSNQLGFPRPLTQLVRRSLMIHNPNPHPVAFKVKTTAPKQYCVRPNSGRVEAGESVEVHVLLQPLSQEPPPHAKCKDKFLVQSAYITPDEEMHTLGEMWSQTEKTNKSAIHEQKIKVVYVASEDGSANANGIPEEPEDGGAAEASRIEDSAIYAHAQSSPTQAAPPVARAPSPPAAPAPAPREIPSLGPADAGATNVALEQSLATTTSDSEKLAVALKEIDKLRAELDESRGPQVTGLRKRGGVANGTGAEVAVEKAKELVGAGSSQGVPLEVVVGLVVGVFVLTYLFF